MTSLIKILILLTSHATLGDTGEPTGVWMEELATPYYAFVDAGMEVDIASIQGGFIPIDPRSIRPSGQNPSSVERFLKDEKAMRLIKVAKPVASLRAKPYAAIFLPGGHGTMWDLPSSKELAGLLSSAWTDGKVVAAVCHGPAGLLQATDTNGQPLVVGRRVSAFSNAEETAAGLAAKVPFLLETRLRELGASYVSGPDFESFAVRDGNLITGQNPASSAAVAQLIITAVRSTPPPAP